MGTGHARAGPTCFVQNGTRHKWSNRGKLPAMVGVVLIGTCVTARLKPRL